MSLLGSIIGGITSSLPIVGNVVGSILGSNAQEDTNESNLQATRETNAANLQAVRETNQLNRELAEYSYSKQYQMWQEANQYNSPAEQMKRLAAAGLNPNLVYGSGSVVGNTSTQTPKYNTPTMESPKFQAPHYDAYTDFGDFGVSAAVESYVRAQQLDMQKEQLEIAKSQSDADIALKNAQSFSTLVGAAKTQEERRQLIDLFPAIQRYQMARATKEEYDSTNSSIMHNVFYAQLENYQSQKKLTETQVEKLMVEIDKLDAELSYINDTYDDNVAKNLAEKKIVEAEAQLKGITGGASGEIVNALGALLRILGLAGKGFGF